MLEQNGFKVDIFESPLLALESFKPCLYDLAILDIKMPEMNGFLFYRKIRKLDYLDIFSSVPANYFMRKPIGNEELITHINQIINDTSIQIISK